MPSRTTHDRRVRSGAAAIAAGALLAALLPAAPAQAATTTTVHGTVQSGSTRLAGVPVGFWSRTGERLASATTGSTGAFTLHVPSGVRGFAYAGARPDASRAIFSVGTRSYVRGVIGASQGRTASYRIYQGHTSATAAHLAGGATLRFTLQKPGRVKVLGGKYFRTNGDREGGFGVLRLNGGFLHETSANPSTGTAWSQWLVAGHHRVRDFPNPPYLGRTGSVPGPA